MFQSKCFPTVSGQNHSPDVMANENSTPIITPSVALKEINLDENPDSITPGTVHANHPRLLTMLAISEKRLSFLIRCRQLKRPPTSFRVRTSKLIDIETAITASSICESTLLEGSILERQRDVKRLTNLVKRSDPLQLDALREKDVSKVQNALHAKFNKFLAHDVDRWADWPLKALPTPKKPRPLLSVKRSRNTIKRQRRASNLLQKVARQSLESGTVVNLSDKEIPPEVISLLSKRTGFVVSSESDSLETRTDCYTTMSKLTRSTSRRLKDNLVDDDQTSLYLDNVAEPIIPASLKRTKVATPIDCGDKLVDGLKEDIMAEIDLMKPKSCRTNLSGAERRGLKWVLNQLNKGDLRVVQADKGGALCIIPKSSMKRLEESKLNDARRYTNMGESDPTPGARSLLLDLWRMGEDSEFVKREECYEVVGLCEKKQGKKQRPSTLSDFKPRTPYFYGLLKIHKLQPEDLKPGVDIPIRLVTNLSQSVTARSDKFINWKYLQDIQVEYCKDLARDSTEVLKWLEALNQNPRAKRSHGFSWDFAALYDNLTPHLVKEALLSAIHDLRPDWSSEFVAWLMELVSLSLDSSFARFGKNWFRSPIGIPTGGALSVTLANIAVYYVLNKIIYSATDTPKDLLGIKRFVDDIGGVWTGSVENFVRWSDHVNHKLQEYGLSIKEKAEDSWDINPPGVHTVFLDIKYTFDESNGLVTDVNIKKTDARVYLHFSSFHPKQTFPSIVYSQALRYRRIINSDDLLKTRLDELSECFLRSGYPRKMVFGILSDVLKRPRVLEYKEKSTDPPFPVVWVQTFGPASETISKVIKVANKVIKDSPVWKDEKNVIGLVNRRGKNIGNLILKRKLFALEEDSSANTGTTRCTPELEPGSKRGKRGRPCEACKLTSGMKTITSTHTGKTFRTPAGNCKSKTLVYGARCIICNKQYVGKTDNRLQCRISGHRSHVKKDQVAEEDRDTDEAALADHLKDEHAMATVALFNLSYSFTILQIEPGDLDQCEQKWVCQLVTMQPFGLNIEKPRGVADSITTMSQKQSDCSKRS